MTTPAVLDSTCLISLERVECIGLVPALLSPVYAPPEVIEEFGGVPEWLTVRSANNQSLLKALSAQLDPGESASIALSTEIENVVVVLDDRKARRFARQLGVPVLGTVGLLLRAKREGLVPEVKRVLDELEKAGFRLSKELRQEALRLAGEVTS